MERNLRDMNMNEMINVCFLRKAFMLNRSLSHMKCTGGCENYKCLMICKINTKIKSCTHCWTEQTSTQKKKLLLLSTLSWTSKNPLFRTHPCKHMEINPGKENERVGFCGDVFSLKLPSPCPQNICFPEEITHENKKQLSYQSF